MSDPAELSRRFLELHRQGDPLLLANVWDAGSARLLESLASAAHEWKEEGTHGFWKDAIAGLQAGKKAID